MGESRRKIRLHTILGVLLIAAVLALNFAGCAKKVSDFTEEEHIKRISERVEKQFITEEKGYTDFSVYPLYDLDEKLSYFLIEFEPYDFILVKLYDEHFLSCIGLGKMYLLSSYGREWSPYSIDETKSQPWPERDICYEVDENGDRINYNRSPYYVTDNLHERKYIFRGYSGHICAIKKDDDTFINLVSSTEMSISNGDLDKEQAVINIIFVGKPQFFL